MTSLKIGNAKVEAEIFDQRSAWDKVNSGHSALPRYVHPLIRHFGDLRSQKMLSYDCRTNTWKRHKADAQYRFIATYDLKLVGVDYNGNGSDAATTQLLNDYVAASGFGDVNTFGQKLGGQFGTRAVPVPRKPFNHWKPAYAFTIYAFPRYHVLRLSLPSHGRFNYVLLAIPFDVRFWGERTYHCEWGMEVDIDYHPITTLGQDLAVPDKTVRDTLFPRLKWELKQARTARAEMRRDLARYKEELAEDPDEAMLPILIATGKARIARADDDISRLKNRLDAYGE
ncbi:MAG: hypothetical protein AAFU86_10885 [Pseudomonadota bacterium]